MNAKIKISIIATYEGMKEAVLKIGYDKDTKILVKAISNENDIKKFVKSEEKNTDVFLSRGATVKIIKENTTVPVVDVPILNFDLIRAIYKAKLDGNKKIGVLHYYKNRYDISEIQKILDVELLTYAYKNVNEIYKKVENLKKLGCKIVIGGGMTPINAKKLGIKSILLTSSDESIKSALDTAKKVTKVKRIEQAKNIRLNAILDSINQGIIVTDEENKITLYNPKAEVIMKVEKEKALGKNIVDIIPNTKMHMTNKEGKLEIGKIQDINGMKIATSRIPIFLEGDSIGVVSIFDETENILKLEKKIRTGLHKKGLLAKYNFEDIITQNKAMMKLKKRARIYAQTNETILINGESGTGKELLAQSIHNESKRKNEPFVAINCATISSSLLESELFGYEGGTFTGGNKDGKMGVFELAHGGTIFLDEIGEIPKDIQASFLRVLQEKEVRRVGGESIIPVDIRIICATNRDLYKEVLAGNFREDLYYRLNIFNLKIPPLRERKDDIPVIVRKILEKYKSTNTEVDEVIEIIKEIPKEYQWKGNIRELENIIRRAYLFVKIPEIYEEREDKELLIEKDLKNCINIMIDINLDLKTTVKNVEKTIISYFLESGYSMEEVLEKLKISRATYMRKK